MAASTGASVDHRRTATVVRVVGALTVVILLADVPLDALTPHFAGAVEAVPFLPFACVGWIVARRQPRNPIGWLLIAIGLGMGIAYLSGPYAVLAFRDGHRGLPLARLASVLTAPWILLVALLPLTILLFPDGRLPSRRWRWSLRVYIALATLFVVAGTAPDLPALYVRHVRVDSLGELASQAGGGFNVGEAAFFLGYAGLALAFAVRQLLECRRATGLRRERFKWLLSGALVALVGTVAIGNPHSTVLDAIGAAGYLAVITLPLGIGFGVLRYRLCEIDRLISRTVSPTPSSRVSLPARSSAWSR